MLDEHEKLISEDIVPMTFVKSIDPEIKTEILKFDLDEATN